MKKNNIIKTILVLCILTLASMSLSSCSNMRMATNYGINIHGGPGGMQVDPYFNVNMYSGGRRY